MPWPRWGATSSPPLQPPSASAARYPSRSGPAPGGTLAIDGPRGGAWVAPAPPTPKPSTRPLASPSRATTYIRPLWTVGVVNLLPVPIGQLPRKVSTPPVGLAAYARDSP